MWGGYLCCVPALIMSLTVNAHADVEARIARCAQSPSAGDRILCLENALRGKPEQDSTVTLPPAPAPAGRGPAEAATRGSETRGPSAASASAPPVALPADAAAARSAEARQFGLDESQRNPERPDSIEVVVTAIEKTVYGKLIYVTDSDQTWQQIDQRRPRYQDLPFPAEIRRGAAGSYFIQPLDGGIAIRVKRRD